MREKEWGLDRTLHGIRPRADSTGTRGRTMRTPRLKDVSVRAQHDGKVHQILVDSVNISCEYLVNSNGEMLSLASKAIIH